MYAQNGWMFYVLDEVIIFPQYEHVIKQKSWNAVAYGDVRKRLKKLGSPPIWGTRTARFTKIELENWFNHQNKKYIDVVAHLRTRMRPTGVSVLQWLKKSVTYAGLSHHMQCLRPTVCGRGGEATVEKIGLASLSTYPPRIISQRWHFQALHAKVRRGSGSLTEEDYTITNSWYPL